ncbi:unnamed protein product [Allacma fusca]|uniref:Uncharacterized protein n=1 Tax=Allacma fusca TaxID=39272 RepID=A0A8J2K0U5_9HEXA|nr:unnamed protein product [Allacma fusca]
MLIRLGLAASLRIIPVLKGRGTKRENISGLLSATCSSEDSIATSSNGSLTSTKRPPSTCVNGACNPDGTCVCNPCWSGPTCQDYVDRFAPRFLAEEPFFMVSVSSGEGREVPLFRIESADDDLGLTCQLGQVGPAATCPCATPRYKVVGPTQAVFRADQETGDVFIKPGFSLQSGKQYLITLQVSVNPTQKEINHFYCTSFRNLPPCPSVYISPKVKNSFAS